MKENKYVSKVVRNKEQKFDFILYINGKPIVQRWFDIKGFNKQSLNSLEIREMMADLVGQEGDLGILTEKLKKDSVNYLWNTYNPYFEQEQEHVDSMFDNNHVFKLEVLYNKRTVATSEFPGNFFPIGKFEKGGRRLQVNITDIIFDMISVIRDYLSRDEYTKP